MKKGVPKSELEIILHKKGTEIKKNKISIDDSNHTASEIIKILNEFEILSPLESKELKEELKITQEYSEITGPKYTELYDFAPSGYYILSDSAEILGLNLMGANILGKERSYLLHRRFTFFIDDDDKIAFSSFLNKVFTSETKVSCEIRLYINKTTLYLHLDGIAIENKKQSLITAIDITEKKINEQRLKINEQKYQTIFENERDSIGIFRLDKDGEPGRFIEVNNATTRLFGYSKEELLSFTVFDLEKVSKKTKDERIRNLKLHGKIDFETVVRTKSGENRDVEVQVALINYINEPAIMNVTRDITERKQLENNIKKAYENLGTIMEAIPDLLFEVGFDGKIYHYQSHSDDLLAVPPEMFIGKFFQEVLPVEASNVIFEALKEANKKGWSIGKQYSLEIQKEKFWFELSVSPINDSKNKDNHFIALSRNITVRKKAIQALKESEEKLQTIFDTANSGILSVNKKGEFIFVNDWWIKNLGYTYEEIYKLTFLDITHPDDIEQSKLLIQKIWNGELDKCSYEKRYIRKDKSVFWGNVSISTNRNKNNEIENATAIVIDITSQKLAEEALKESEKFLKETQFIAQLGSYSLDIQTSKWTSSEILDSIFGINSNFDHTIENWTIIIHPEWRQTMMDYLSNDVIGKKQVFDKEYKITNQNNQEERWVHGMGELVFNDKNEPIKMIGTIQDITERKEADEALSESEIFLKKTQLIANLGTYTLDIETATWKTSQVLDSIFGIDTNYEKSLSGWKPIIHKDWREPVTEHFFSDVLGKKNTFDLEFKIIRQNDGSERWIHGLGELQFNDKNEPIKMLGSIQDITERKEKFKELEKLNRAHLLNSEINNLILRAHNQETLFQEICKIAVTYGKFRMCWIGLLDEVTNEIIPTNWYGYEEGYLSKLKSIHIENPDEGKGPAAQAILTGKTIVCNDIANDSKMKPWRNEALKRGYNSSLALPIIIRNKTIGIFNLYSEENNFFMSKEEIELLEKVSDNMAFSIETILNKQDRKQAEERFRDIVDSTNGIVWEADAKTSTYSYISKQAERLTGYTLEEWCVPRFWENHLHPDDKQKIIDFCALQTEKMISYDITYRFITKKNKIIWLKALTNVIEEDGKPKWLRGVMFDITDQKEIEESLFESEEKYRSLVENSTNAIVIHVDSKIVFVNNECVNLIASKNKNQILGKSILQFVHPFNRAEVYKILKEVSIEGNSFPSTEEKFLRMDGVTIDVEIKAIPTIFQHKQAVQLIIQDITERKKSEVQLRQLSQAVEQNPATIVITDILGNIQYVNPKFELTTGYSFEEVKGKNPRILNSGHTKPDEYKKMWDSIVLGNDWHGEFYNKRKDGTFTGNMP